MRSWKYFLLLPIIVCCQGEDGAMGPAGLNSLFIVSTETPGANCQNGGIKVSAGSDKNANNVLDEEEITNTSYVCNGINGNSTLTSVVAEPKGTNCENGGVKIISGVDTNNNGDLDLAEITSTAYACNGIDGKMSLVTVVQEPSGTNCLNGGIKISSGIDINGDGTLNNSEISVTRFICNGKDGDNEEQIRIKVEYPLNNNAFDYFGTSSSAYQFAGVGLIDFDKRFFVGVDSIVFTCNPISFGSAKAFVELYNATDNEPIAGSELSALFTFANRQFIKSPNIYDALPGKKIDLGIRVRSETNGADVASGTPYLILYRRN